MNFVYAFSSISQITEVAATILLSMYCACFNCTICVWIPFYLSFHFLSLIVLLFLSGKKDSHFSWKRREKKDSKLLSLCLVWKWKGRHPCSLHSVILQQASVKSVSLFSSSLIYCFWLYSITWQFLYKIIFLVFFCKQW